MDKLQLDDFTKYKFLSGLKYSPEGNKLGFIMHKIDVENNKYLSDIYIYDIQDENIIKLTSSNTVKSFIFKDEDTLIFPDTRDKKEDCTCIYEISLKGGEANKILEIPLTISELKILDEDSLLLTAEYDHYKPSSKEEKEEEKDYQVIDEIPFWSNGEGYTNKKRNRLYLYNLKNEKANPITDEFTNVHSFNLNKEKNKIIIITSSFTDKMQLKDDLYIYDLDNKNLEKLNHTDPFSYSYADFLGKEIIFLGSSMTKHGINENSKIYMMDKDRNVRMISPEGFDYSFGSSVGSDCRLGRSTSVKVDGDYLYFISTEYGNAYLNRMNTSGTMERLTEEKGSVDGFDVHDGNIVFVGFRDLKIQELYRLKDGQEIQISKFNEWLNDEKTLSTPERITFQTEKGITIEGWVMKPVDYEEGKQYPAILDIHGGPKTAYGDVFYHEMQYWTNHGYVVFFCNPRGSDGRGDEFADIRGKYGTIDYEDIMKFTDLVLDEYSFIDKDKIGVTGGSYGGFMTNWIIGHTNRYKAAVSQRSISNWLSKFGTTDIGYYFTEDQQGANPWSDPEKLWWHSPMKYADKAQTPTLFIHSEEDYRCWIAEGYQMFTSLKYNGVEARLCLFKGENHELSRSGKPKHRIRRLKEMTDWFDKYLK